MRTTINFTKSKPKGIAGQLAAMGLSPSQIALATIGGVPVPKVDLEPRSRIPRGMNKTEALYSHHLESLRLAGEILAWRFEAIKVRLADRSWYRPDFIVWLPDGRLRLVEIKGFRREAALVRFRVARDLYPQWDWWMLERRGGQWVRILEK